MSKLLRDAGEAMYGSRWQTDLSRDLQVSNRTIRRWASGADDVPPGAWLDLLRLTMERALALDNLADRLKREAAPS